MLLLALAAHDHDRLLHERAQAFVVVAEREEYGGPAGTFREVRAQRIAGRLCAKPSFAIPAMGTGQKLVVPLVFGREITHEFEWTREPWSRSQIASPDAGRTRGPDWLQLFSGAQARVSVDSNCATGRANVLEQRMPIL